MSHWRDTGETVPSGRCDDCDASVWHLRVLVHDDGCKTELCERCRDQYILQQGKSAIIAQASPCPACEAAAKQIAHRERQIAALVETIDGWESKYLISRQHNEKLADENYRLAVIEQELADLRARFTAAIDDLQEMAAVMKKHQMLPHTSAAIAERVAELTGNNFQPDDLRERNNWSGEADYHYEHLHCPTPCPRCESLRAQIEALANEMETDDRAGKLAHWIISLRKIAEKEAK